MVTEHAATANQANYITQSTSKSLTIHAVIEQTADTYVTILKMD